MLEVVKTLQTLLRDGLELFEISAALGVSRCRGGLFNATKDLIHRGFRFETEIAQRLRCDHRRQKATHRLFGATVWVVDEIWQRVEHRGSHARRDLNCQPG